MFHWNEPTEKQKQILTAAVKTTPTKWFSLDSQIEVSSLRLCISVDPSCLCVCFWQMGSLKNVTVLFLHSNKLETLPEEMGDMQKLKVINLSDNKYVQTSYHTHVHNTLQRMLTLPDDLYQSFHFHPKWLPFLKSYY